MYNSKLALSFHVNYVNDVSGPSFFFFWVFSVFSLNITCAVSYDSYCSE